jgi:hypothetical protein
LGWWLRSSRLGCDVDAPLSSPLLHNVRLRLCGEYVMLRSSVRLLKSEVLLLMGGKNVLLVERRKNMLLLLALGVGIMELWLLMCLHS